MTTVFLLIKVRVLVWGKASKGWLQSLAHGNHINTKLGSMCLTTPCGIRWKNKEELPSLTKWSDKMNLSLFFFLVALFFSVYIFKPILINIYFISSVWNQLSIDTIQPKKRVSRWWQTRPLKLRYSPWCTLTYGLLRIVKI